MPFSKYTAWWFCISNFHTCTVYSISTTIQQGYVRRLLGIQLKSCITCSLLMYGCGLPLQLPIFWRYILKTKILSRQILEKIIFSVIIVAAHILLFIVFPYPNYFKYECIIYKIRSQIFYRKKYLSYSYVILDMSLRMLRWENVYEDCILNGEPVRIIRSWSWIFIGILL